MNPWLGMGLERRSCTSLNESLARDGAGAKVVYVFGRINTATRSIFEHKFRVFSSSRDLILRWYCTYLTVLVVDI